MGVNECVSLETTISMTYDRLLYLNCFCVALNWLVLCKYQILLAYVGENDHNATII